MAPEAKVVLAGEAFALERQRLRGWLALQVARERLEDAVARKDAAGICDALLGALASCLPPRAEEAARRAAWYEVIAAWSAVCAVNRVPDPDRFALLQAGGADSHPAEPWHYLGRIRYALVHIIASAYGWTEGEVMRLWPEDAVAYLQEILAEQHAEREFQHALSQVAYDVAPGGRARYRPLPKPRWMRTLARARQSRSVASGRIPASLLPTGIVIQVPGTERPQ